MLTVHDSESSKNGVSITGPKEKNAMLSVVWAKINSRMTKTRRAAEFAFRLNIHESFVQNPVRISCIHNTIDNARYMEEKKEMTVFTASTIIAVRGDGSTAVSLLPVSSCQTNDDAILLLPTHNKKTPVSL